MKSNKYLILEEIKYWYLYAIVSLVVWTLVILWLLFKGDLGDYPLFWLYFLLGADLYFFYVGIKWVQKRNEIDHKKKTWNKISARVTDIWETEYRSTKYTRITLHDYDEDDTYYTDTFIDVSEILRHWDLVDIYINPNDVDDYYVDINPILIKYAIKNNWIKKDDKFVK